MFTENDVRIMLEKMFSEGRRYESAKYQPQSFSEAVKYYSDKIISAQQSVQPTCHTCAIFGQVTGAARVTQTVLWHVESRGYMFWKLKRKSLIWLSNVFRNWSDAINEYLWNDKVDVSFQAVEQPLAPDAFCGCPPETRTSNVHPSICPVCKKPRR